MHDPMTVAFEIRWLGLTIWHVDPETDGSDDSCGWFRPGLTKEDIEWCQEVPRSVHDMPTPGYSCTETLCALWRHVRRRVWGTHLREPLSHKHLAELLELSSVPWNNLRDCVMLFHAGNSYEQGRLMMILLKTAKNMKRRWWQHPRWHIHHWKLSLQVVHNVKRMSQRCAGCGKRFKYGYCPVAAGWSKSAPLYHHACHATSLSEQGGKE